MVKPPVEKLYNIKFLRSFRHFSFDTSQIIEIKNYFHIMKLFMKITISPSGYTIYIFVMNKKQTSIFFGQTYKKSNLINRSNTSNALTLYIKNHSRKR